jgi:hypothetical protein
MAAGVEPVESEEGTAAGPVAGAAGSMRVVWTDSMVPAAWDAVLSPEFNAALCARHAIGVISPQIAVPSRMAILKLFFIVTVLRDA